MSHLCLAVVLVLPALASADGKTGAAALSPKEIADGWICLYDGQTPFGWEIDGQARMAKGQLILGGTRATKAVCRTQFGGCELRVEGRSEGPRAAVAVLRARQRDFSGRLPAAPNEGGWTEVSLRSTPEQAPAKVELVVPAGSRLVVRKVKVRPEGLQEVFNGKDLTGWQEVKTKRTRSRFTVTDQGELNVKDGPGDLQTEQQWDDFVLQLEVFSNGKHLNSGVFFRAIPGQFWSGYEAQIRNQWEGEDRSRPVDYGTGGIYNRQPARKVVSSDREWFTMTVVAQGRHLAVWVNGYQTADFTDPRRLSNNARQGCKLAKGPISLQGHDPTTDLSFRHIRIAPMPREPAKAKSGR